MFFDGFLGSFLYSSAGCGRSISILLLPNLAAHSVESSRGQAMEMRGRTVCKDGLEGVYAVCDDQACTGLCQLFLGTPSLVCLLGFSF